MGKEKEGTLAKRKTLWNKRKKGEGKEKKKEKKIL